jgi:hypothetical protein
MSKHESFKLFPLESRSGKHKTKPEKFCLLVLQLWLHLKNLLTNKIDISRKALLANRNGAFHFLPARSKSESDLLVFVFLILIVLIKRNRKLNFHSGLNPNWNYTVTF